jgi:hypothetical protein
MAGMSGKNLKSLVKLWRRLNRRPMITVPDFDYAKKELRDILIQAASGNREFEEWILEEISKDYEKP